MHGAPCGVESVDRTLSASPRVTGERFLRPLRGDSNSCFRTVRCHFALCSRMPGKTLPAPTPLAPPSNNRRSTMVGELAKSCGISARSCPGFDDRGKTRRACGPAEIALDAAHGVPAPRGRRSRRVARRRERPVAATKEHAPGDRPLAVLAWLTLLLGTTGFVSGLALMGWSMSANRADLWTVGTRPFWPGRSS